MTKIFHCNISDNSVNLGGIFAIESNNLSVENCKLRHNGAAVSLEKTMNVTISYCSFRYNTHFAIALRKPSKDVIITRCDIENNLRYGIYIENDNICRINNNNFYNQTLYSIYIKGTRCDARYNWWGSSLGPFLTFLRSSTRITLLLGIIRVTPWSVSPYSDVGIDWNENYVLATPIVYKIQKIFFNETDTDNDGVPDWWEQKWNYSIYNWEDHIHLDPDNDALTNIEECYTDIYGSNPYRINIFLEFDLMESQNPEETNQPPLNLLNNLQEIFSQHNISLHIDVGNMGGGEEIPFCPDTFSFIKLQNLYWDFFLHNDINNPRKDIFHYGLICNYCPDLNFPFFGWDQLNSFAISANWLKTLYPMKSKNRLIVGAAVHHLGHTLGLLADTYGGIDNDGTVKIFSKQWWMYENYQSCMNYFYKYMLYSFSDGSHGYGDFNDWAHLNYNFFKNSTFKKNQI